MQTGRARFARRSAVPRGTRAFWRISVKRLLSLAALALAVVTVGLGAATTTSAATPSYTLFGDASVSGGVFQLRSDNDPGYGGIDFAIPSGLTGSDLTYLGTQYNVTDDDCGGGSPRFQLNTTNGKNIFVYTGPAPNFSGCAPGWQDTGDLLTSPDLRCDFTQLGGPFYGSCALLKTTYDVPITGIQLVVDAGWAFPDGEQTVLFRNINITFETPTDKDQCKDGGWRLFDSPTFRNQGDCVSFVASGGRSRPNR
jgi:hypothetical protein